MSTTQTLCTGSGYKKAGISMYKSLQSIQNMAFADVTGADAYAKFIVCTSAHIISYYLNLHANGFYEYVIHVEPVSNKC